MVSEHVPSQAQKDATLAQILENMEQREQALQEIINSPHYLIRDGEVAHDPTTGEPVLDPGPAEAAGRELAAVRKQRDKLLGHEPVKHYRVVVPPGTDPVSVATEIAARDAAEDMEDGDEPEDAEDGEYGSL